MRTCNVIVNIHAISCFCSASLFSPHIHKNDDLEHKRPIKVVQSFNGKQFKTNRKYESVILKEQVSTDCHKRF